MVARIMGVHRATVWNWIQQGKLRATTPQVPDKKDPSKLVPVSDRYRGVAKADLAEWRRVYPSQAPVSKRARPTSKKKRAKKRAGRSKARNAGR
jgi:hypothetical protein